MIRKKSRIKRVIPRRLADAITVATGSRKQTLEKKAEDDARYEIERQREKGWKLVTRLETGEGVFVRDDDVVGLHIQLPTALYRRLDVEAHRREVTKRQIVIAALEHYLKEGS